MKRLQQVIPASIVSYFLLCPSLFYTELSKSKVPLTNFHYPSTKQTQSIRPYLVWAFKNTSWRAYPTLWLISYHIAAIMTTVYKGLTTVKTFVIWRIKTSVVTPQYLNSAGFLVNYKTGTIDYHRMSANQYYQTRKQCIN